MIAYILLSSLLVMQAYLDKYFSRFADAKPILSAPPNAVINATIVIPCYNEPDLIGTLQSLANCEPLPYPVEVIVVVNQSEQVAPEVAAQNQKTIEEFEQWVAAWQGQHLYFHLIKALDLPAKQAGVGLARKIGMDEALRRFQATGVNGAIICLDADCRVSANYLQAIHEQFVASNVGLGEMYYEHAYESEVDPALRTGIVNYELFLRYYVAGLKQAGFPNAIQTVGSCMLVKAATYAKHGGMNKRKAGEDFYFLHKIIPHEKFVNVNSATVYPSCRTSDRVPFGTGKAQQDWLDQDSNEYMTYDPKIFKELNDLLKRVNDFFSGDTVDVAYGVSGPNQQFIDQHRSLEKIKLIRANTRDQTQFRKQFFIWFDGFMCMKYVHFMRDQFYPNIPIEKAAGQLIGEKRLKADELLGRYRINDRGPA